MAECSVKIEHTHELSQAEEDNQPALQNAAASSEILNIQEKKDSSGKRRKRKPRFKMLPHRVGLLEPWNMIICELTPTASMKFLEMTTFRMNPMDRHNPKTCLDARKLRKRRPNYIPVTLEKDPSSDIRDIDMKKYNVHADTSLRAFVYFIGLRIGCSTKKPLYVSFKNTEPPMTALMSTIDEENKDEDGYLHMTYSGRDKNALAQGNIRDLYLDASTKNTIIWRGHMMFLDSLDTRACQLAADPRNLRFLSEEVKRILIAGYNRRNCFDGWKLREKRPDHIPVHVEKDAKSGIPDIARKKYHVFGGISLEEFVRFIQLKIRLKGKPLFVFFKNTVPPSGTLLSTIDEENKDEDGYLHITYSGKEFLDPNPMMSKL